MNISLNTALNEYLLDCQNGNRGEKTIRAYQDTLHDFLTFVGDISVAILSQEHIKRYIQAVSLRHGRNGELSVHSIHKYYSVVRTFARWLYAHGYISMPIVEPSDLPQPALETPDTLTEEEFNKLLDYLQEKGDFRDLVVFEVLLGTGLRVHELTSLNLADVNLEAGTITVKSKDERGSVVPFGNTVKQDLSTYIQDHRNPSSSERAVFLNHFGSRLKPEGLNMLIKRTLHKIRGNGKCGAETLRNTFAISFLRNGGSDVALHFILRNADIRTTQRFITAVSNNR